MLRRMQPESLSKAIQLSVAPVFLLAGIGEVDASKNSNFLVVTPSNPCARARCLRFSCNWVCRVMLTSNLPFSKWEAIFKDPMTTAAAIDRLVHHSVILELNIPSYRLEQAKQAKTTAAKA